VVGVGVGTAGQVNFEAGTVVSGTPNIRDWMNVDLRSALEPIGFPVWVDNDVNVHLLAETRFGVAAGRQHVLMLALGTGVGGAAWEDGRLVRGDWGAACEFGHVCVDYRGPDCNCGSRGCLELYASGTGIARMMRERLAQTGGSTPSPTLDARAVLQQAQAGDPVAAAVVHDMLDALSMACVSLIHAFNPQMIVLGGGVMESGEWLLTGVRERVKTLGMSSLVRPVAIAAAQFGAEAGVVGAALQSFLYEQTLEE
jgi:glucokinase